MEVREYRVGQNCKSTTISVTRNTALRKDLPPRIASYMLYVQDEHGVQPHIDALQRDETKKSTVIAAQDPKTRLQYQESSDIWNCCACSEPYHALILSGLLPLGYCCCERCKHV